MLKRVCERCDVVIERGKPYIKVCLSSMENKNQKLKHIGDLCQRCWDMMKKTEEK